MGLLLLLACARRRMGEAQAAVELLEPLCREQPRWAAAQLELGIALGQLGRGKEAVAALSRAAEASPTLPGVWRRLGDSFMRVARQSCRQVIRVPSTVRPAIKPWFERI